MPKAEFLDSIQPWQLEVLKAFDDSVARFFMLCWHRRARKTTVGINLLIRECLKYENRVYGYIAPTYTQAKSIVWRDPNMLPKYLPMELVKRKNESELYVEFVNGSVLVIKGADNPDSIRGQDYSGVFLDEWALMKSIVWEEILRPIISQDDKRWAIFAFTPKGRNFVYDYWLKADKWHDWYKSFLSVNDSKIIPADELEKAKAQMPQKLYEQEFLCSFLADEENTLIPMVEVEDLKNYTNYPKEIRRIIACDPSQGGDECVIYVIQNSAIIGKKILHEQDTMKIAGEISAMMFKYDTPTAVVDSIGIGAGICDRLSELGKRVIRINSAEKANDEEHFNNLRTEIWWYLAQQIKNHKIDYPDDEELVRELSFVKCFVMNSRGKMRLEPKEKTKEVLGRSPDRADAFVYGIWALKDTEPIKGKDAWRDEEDNNEVSTGVNSAMVA